jgi:hypothetical protein
MAVNKTILEDSGYKYPEDRNGMIDVIGDVIHNDYIIWNAKNHDNPNYDVKHANKEHMEIMEFLEALKKERHNGSR